MTGQPGREILVTGGGGFLGSAVVRQLVARGDHVRSLARNAYPELDALGVTQIQGDISRPGAVLDACEGVDAVCHTAAKPGVWGDYEDYFRPNVLGTTNIVDACKKHRIPVLVHTSSPSVVFNGRDMEGVDESCPYPGEHPTHYTRTKAMAEKLVVEAARKGDITAVVLRPHLIWGPGDPHLVPRVIERAARLVRVGKADKLVDTIYIEDAANAHVLALDALAEKPALSGRIYFISQDDPVPMFDMLDDILAAAGIKPIQKTLPAGLVYGVGALLEAVYTLLRKTDEPPMTRFVAKELATAHWFNISAAKTDLGYQPQRTVQQGLKELGQWLSRQTDIKHR